MVKVLYVIFKQKSCLDAQHFEEKRLLETDIHMDSVSNVLG